MRPALPLVPGLLALSSTLACSSSPTSPRVPQATGFVLRVGESAAVAGTGLELRFEAVLHDSRCPSNAICIALGDAEAAIGVRRDGRAAAGLSLHTTPGDGQRARVGEWVVTLERLDPYPLAGRSIDPAEYQARLRVDAAS